MFRLTFASTALFVTVAGVAIVVSGCSKKDAADAMAGKAAMPAVSVGTTDVELRPMAEHLTVSSELVPYQEIDVYAKEAGYVKKLNVDFGSHVHEGDVMAVLEIPELEAQLKQDDAAIRARTNEVTRAQKMVGSAKAQHDVLHLQYTRLDEVAKSGKGLVAQQEVDDAQSKDLASEANVEAAQGALDAAGSEVVEAKAKLTHDQALYDYSKITAPFTGVVTQRYANFGALMQAGTSSTQATPLVRLSQEDKFRLVIPVPETYVGLIRIGDPVEVKIPALNSTVIGKVDRTSIDVNSSTRTLHTEVDVPNPTGKLVPGLYAEANLTLNQRGKVATVPIQAIDRQGDQASVMVLQRDNTVARRPVMLGVQTANYAEIASGVNAGDRIIVSDRSGLKQGEHVTEHAMQALSYGSSQ